MKRALLTLIIVTVACVSSQDCSGKDKYTKDCPPTSPPVWADQFEQDFTETNTYPILGSQTTKGKLIYDWTNKKYVVERENGHYDRYCGSVYKFSNTPCNHIVSDGDRYLHFPEKDYCCYCCSNEHGCGLLKPDWLSGAEFVEYETEEDGTVYEKWNKPGAQNNFYYALAQDRRVIQKIDQQPNDVQVYDVSSYHAGISDPNVFNLPSKCRKDFTCPFISICTAVRKLVSNVSFLQDN